MLVVALAVVLLLGGCTDATPVVDRSATSSTSIMSGMSTEDGVVSGSAASLPSADVVDLTVYLRRGHGEDAHLMPVIREVPMVSTGDGDDMAAGHTSTEPRAHLLRRAVELLVAGPVPDDGAGLSAALPPTTTVHGVEVSGTTAHVDLSAEVVRDRTMVGASAAHELLALAALANTLTEFPDIDHVELAIDGRRHGVVDGVDVDAFWGWWGLPARLARDASLVGPSPDGTTLPDYSAFGTAPQSVAPGTPDGGDPPPVDVAAVRHELRATTVRVSVELAAIGEELPATPAVRARPTDDGVLLEIEGVAAVDDEVATSLPLDAVPYTAVTIDDKAVEDGTGPVRVLVRGEPDAFQLSTMTNPMRVVLDLRT